MHPTSCVSPKSRTTGVRSRTAPAKEPKTTIETNSQNDTAPTQKAEWVNSQVVQPMITRRTIAPVFEIVAPRLKMAKSEDRNRPRGTRNRRAEKDLASCSSPQDPR